MKVNSIQSSLALYDSNHDSIPGILRRDFQVSRTTLTDTKSTERGALNDAGEIDRLRRHEEFDESHIQVLVWTQVVFERLAPTGSVANGELALSRESRVAPESERRWLIVLRCISSAC